MTRPDLDALQALLDKAAPGPWYAADGGIDTPDGDLLALINLAMPIERRCATAALIVAAVNALPALLAYVRELERERDRYRDALLARHGGEPLALLDELDAARVETRTAAIAMRERCARACEKRVMGDNNREDAEAKRCAAAIRALEP